MSAPPSIGHATARFEEVASTIDEARRLAGEGAEHGMVVRADRQTRGRGRRGHEWHTLPDKSLAATVILRELPGRDHLGLAGMTAALAVVTAADTLLGLRLQTKWPNDVLGRGRKLAGTLGEMAGDALLLSLGVNLNGTETDLPAELRERATTLQLLTGSPVDQEHVVAATFVALDAWWAALRRDPDAVLTRWDALDVTRGARVTVADGAERVSGRALGVDACGRLRLETASGSVLLLLGGEVGIID